MSAERVGLIKQRAKEWVEGGLTPALVVCAAHKGIIVVHEALGRLRPGDNSPPVQQDTIFPLQSLSKPITGTAVMILVDDGLVGLNRPVGEYIPEFRGDKRDQIMVHHFLTHTSGIFQQDVEAHHEQRTRALESGELRVETGSAVHEFVREAYDVPVRKNPGEEMSYLGRGYTLLGEIVRRVSGKPLGEFAEERIFRPLGMRNTSFGLPPERRDRLVRRPAGAVDAEFDDAYLWYQPPGASGAYSTAVDLAAFGQMFLNGGAYGDRQILSAAAVAEAMRNQVPGVASTLGEEFFPEAGWSYGWYLRLDKKWCGSLYSPASIEHSGSGGVYEWIDPDNQIVGVYLSVLLEERGELQPVWAADLFSNMVTAAVEGG